ARSVKRTLRRLRSRGKPATHESGGSISASCRASATTAANNGSPYGTASRPTSSSGGRHERSRSTTHPNSIAAFRSAIESGVNRGDRMSVFVMQRHAIKHLQIVGDKSPYHSFNG